MKQTILERLVSQLIAKGFTRHDATVTAKRVLEKSGSIDTSGKLTDKGRTRSDMGASGRAIDREIQRHGGKPSDYVYNPHTNKAHKK